MTACRVEDRAKPDSRRGALYGRVRTVGHVPISLLEATIFDASRNRWPRCPACVSEPYQLCDHCAATYHGGIQTEVCSECATANTGLAAHAQRHSVVLDLCVDDGICDLVEALTHFGAHTVASCAGSPELALGRPYVGLKDLDSLHAVLAAAFDAASADGDGGRDARVLGLPTVPAVRRWALSLVPIVRSGNIELVPHLDLPADDLDWLGEVLTRATSTATIKTGPDRPSRR